MVLLIFCFLLEDLSPFATLFYLLVIFETLSTLTHRTSILTNKQIFTVETSVQLKMSMQ